MVTLLVGALQHRGHQAVGVHAGQDALDLVGREDFDVVLTDLRMEPVDGMAVLQGVRARSADTQVIVLTAYGAVETAVAALQAGAFQYLTKPFNFNEVVHVVEQAAETRALAAQNRGFRKAAGAGQPRGLLGGSEAARSLRTLIARVAPSDATVLVRGESGSGKEVVARAIHAASGRADAPFVAVNCAAIAETLLESELFGYRKGAFTGADRDHDGYFARAHGGSIFLDDVDDLPPNVQVKLLRVLQEREIPPVGGGAPVPVDFRLITATKEDLKELTVRGAFREDLYYRLNVIPLPLPTLAERREDIPALVRHFVSARGEEADFDFSQDRLQALLEYHWPGNVRELENVVERMLALPNVPVRDLFDGPLRGSGRPGPAAPAIPGDAVPTYREYMERCEEQLLRHALDRADGNVTTAAQLLDLPRSTLRSKLEKH